MKSNLNVRPTILENLGNGVFHYSCNIKVAEVQPADFQQEKTEVPQIGYEYETVQVWENQNYYICANAVLCDCWNETEEFKLVNKCKTFSLGLSKDLVDEVMYKKYLTKILAFKAMVSLNYRV